MPGPTWPQPSMPSRGCASRAPPAHPLCPPPCMRTLHTGLGVDVAVPLSHVSPDIAGVQQHGCDAFRRQVDRQALVDWAQTRGARANMEASVAAGSPASADTPGVAQVQLHASLRHRTYQCLAPPCSLGLHMGGQHGQVQRLSGGCLACQVKKAGERSSISCMHTAASHA